VFTCGLNLPRGRDREVVHDTRDREYTLRGSESRSLATAGAFRVVPARDLRDYADRPGDPRNADLRHLREQGLIETVRIPGYREQAVVLTDRGRDLLEANRDRDRDTGQAFYAGLNRERETAQWAQEHDLPYLDGHVHFPDCQVSRIFQDPAPQSLADGSDSSKEIFRIN
jgi:hypothetical protein